MPRPLEYVSLRVRRRLVTLGLNYLHRAGLVEFGLNYRFLIAGVNGVYLYDRGRITKLLEGEFFGLTPTDTPGEYYFAICSNDVEKKDYHGRILHCRFDGQEARVLGEVPLIREGKPEKAMRIHQVRWHEGHLWIVNTMGNVLWKVTPEGQVVGEWTDNVFFSGETPGQKILSSREYKHYNSVAFRDGLTYLLAHNSGGKDKSGQSYVVVLDSDLKEVSRREGVGWACHDLLWRGDDLYVCDSGGHRLLKNYEPVLQTDRFLRGLTAVGSILILAGTDWEPDKAQRRLAGSVLYFVDQSSFHVLHTLVFNRLGPIHDLLFLEEVPTLPQVRSRDARVQEPQGAGGGAR
jgi:hypothetical protein